MSPDHWRLKRVMGLIGDPKGKRILDLACRTGIFSAALANAGADVLGIEGRQENLDQAPPSSARLEVGDIRVLPTELGQFDVILCLGILYHLDAANALALLANMRKLTDLVILDTHISYPEHDTTVVVDSHAYRGHTYSEKGDGPWSSLDPTQSWWFTTGALNEAFLSAGWRGSPVPSKAYPGEPDDRRWYVLEPA